MANGIVLTTFGFLDYYLKKMPYYKILTRLGRGDGQVVSMLAFYSVDPSSNPAEAYSFML